MAVEVSSAAITSLGHRPSAPSKPRLLLPAVQSITVGSCHVARCRTLLAQQRSWSRFVAPHGQSQSQSDGRGLQNSCSIGLQRGFASRNGGGSSRRPRQLAAWEGAAGGGASAAAAGSPDQKEVNGAIKSPESASKPPIDGSGSKPTANSGPSELAADSAAADAAAAAAGSADTIAAAAGGGAAAGTWQEGVSPEVDAEVNSRVKRLGVLMLLKRLYRDVVRSNRVLEMPIPKVRRNKEGTQELKLRRARRGGVVSYVSSRGDGALRDEDFFVESPLEVLNCAEDIRELGTALRRDMTGFHGQLSVVFPEDKSAEQQVWETVVGLSAKLEGLAERVEASLTAEEKQQAMEELRSEQQQQEENVKSKVLRGLESLPPTASAVLERVKQRIAAVDLSLRINDLNLDLNNIQGAGRNILRTLSATWSRLNGQEERPDADLFGQGLPRPSSTLAELEREKMALILEVEALDKKLGEASRSRESRLRQRNVLARTRLAKEIRGLDDEVNELRKSLAVRTLQLEMTLIFSGLEAELLFLTGSQDQRTDEDESLLIAEFALLDFDLARLRTAVDRKEAILIDDEELEALAAEIPDLKARLGISEEASIPLQQRVSITVDESVGKVKEGSSFFWRGMRLLGSDIVYSFRLFWAAVNGATLKAREVQALRRTAKDIIVLIPFTIILIAPITPIGHVAVFSFLQRYFPGFFPSAFSNRRQDVMKRYELIREQMQGAVSESERAEVKKRAEAAAEETFAATVDEEEAQEGEKKTKLKLEVFQPFSKRTEELGEMRSTRLWRDEPRKLLMLQDKLPQLAIFLSSLRNSEDSSGLSSNDELLRRLKSYGTSESPYTETDSGTKSQELA